MIKESSFDVRPKLSSLNDNSQWRIQGRVPGGTAPRYFLTKMRPERPKKSFWRPGPSLISLSR